MNVLEINVLVLAYLGDTIYENYVRHYLISKKISNVNDLQTESIKYVSARAQAKFLEELINNNFFTEEELNVIRRARNYKSRSHPKNTDIITYKHATGLEAVIGYLDLTIWLEGWSALQHGAVPANSQNQNANTSIIWDSEAYAKKSFNVGMTFGVQLHANNE